MGEEEEEEADPSCDVIVGEIDWSHMASLIKQKEEETVYLTEPSESLQHEIEAGLQQYSIVHFPYEDFEGSMFDNVSIIDAPYDFEGSTLDNVPKVHRIAFYWPCPPDQEDMTEEQQTDFVNHAVDTIVEGMDTVHIMRVYVDVCVRKHGTTIEPSFRCLIVHE